MWKKDKRYLNKFVKTLQDVVLEKTLLPTVMKLSVRFTSMIITRNAIHRFLSTS